MKRIAKYLSIAALVLALVFTMAGWVLNRWLQSPAFRTAFEEELSRALRTPVKTGALTFSMWSGLAVQRIAVTGADGSTFEAAGVSASHRFSSLLRGKFTLSEVRIEQPHFRLIEDAAGNWRLPRNESAAPIVASPQPSAAGEIGTQPSAPAVVPAVSGQAGSPSAATPFPAAPAPSKNAKSRVSIARIVLVGGTVELMDKTRAPFATFTGLNVTLNEAPGENFTGRFDIQRATLHGWLALDKLTGIVSRDGRIIQIRQLSANTGGGTLSGDATWTEGASGTADVKFNRINIARTAQDAGAANPRVGGMLSGEAHFAGLGADKNAITGKGTLDLKGGNCREIELLRQIGEVLQIAAIASFEISDVSTAFSVAQGQVILAPADVAAPPVGVTLTGPVAFDGALNLSAILHAPADFVARQPLVAGQFSPPDANNRRGVPFNITGTLKKPRQNLAEKLCGTKDRKQQRIIAAGSILSALMDRKKPKLAQPAPETPPAPPDLTAPPAPRDLVAPPAPAPR